MEHLGDITKLNGYEVPVVDVVIGGSPCQDLSIAGKRAGLAGARSGLFMEQVRIVKEMREADAGRGRAGESIRPRYMVWENVPGAFSSNKGEDFRAVLEETIRIAQPDAPDVPLPAKGRWPLADCWMGDGWSVAYRVLDAQFWGVPQRRRRIALVADLGGHAAPEILFVRKGVSGDLDEGGAAGQAAPSGAGAGAGAAVSLRMRSGCEGGGKGALVQVEKSGTLGCNNDQTIFRLCGGFKPHSGASAGSIGYQEETAPTIDTGKPMAVYDARRASCAAVCRLTPLECERLQGFPDGWTDIGPWRDSAGKLHKRSSDSARYKALGNSIALPPWAWVLKRLCACYERPATMASLFDGIGGFPLIWERLNGPGSCLWASEIEEFPMAVTAYHFGEPQERWRGGTAYGPLLL